MRDPTQLPSDLPVPEDDGAADHLKGAPLPPVALAATDGPAVRLDELPGLSVVFAYPRTGRPGEEPPGGEAGWNAIPGARGCTPEACSFRDELARFPAIGVRVFGLSTQDTAISARPPSGSTCRIRCCRTRSWSTRARSACRPSRSRG